MKQKIILYGYPVVVPLLVSSPVIWLWGYPAVALKVAITALYLLTMLFVYRKWL